MAYTPTTWNTGDTVNATKLNKMEQGIANAGSAMIVTDTSGTLNKTVREIYEAISGGTPVFIQYRDGDIESPQVNYTAIEVLNPVVSVFRYGDDLNDSLFRVLALHTKTVSVSNYSYAFTPAMVLYSATAIDSYPAYYVTVAPASSATSNNRW